MTLNFAKHEKLSLRKHPVLNERWLQDRIEEDPSILGLGSELRLLDRERPLAGGGRLDLLLFDDDNNRRFEVEIQLGATDPSHIIRCIEYWDLERRKYPGYEHIAVIIAEDVTTRFLNVMSLMSGSIPIIAIQLDALRIGDHVLLNFTQILDQSELRTDDIEDDTGGGESDRNYWEKKAGGELMKLCDGLVGVINEFGTRSQEPKYLKGYIGLRSNGVVNNFINFNPKRTKHLVHVGIRNSNATQWKDRFEEAGIPVTNKRKNRVRISISPKDFDENLEIIREAIKESVTEFES